MAPVRYVLKYQADAWKAAFRGGGFPRFKNRRGDDSITLPSGTVHIRCGKLHFPRIGPMVLRRRGGNPYPTGKPLQVIVKRCLGKWYATVTYAVELPEPADNGEALGLDRNVAQVATSSGEFYRTPHVARLEARRKRYQRMMARRVKGSKRRALARHRAAKTARSIAGIRKNWQHQTSCSLAEAAGTIVIERLNVQGMTRSAKGTVEEPGKNVRQKAGLNRSLLSVNQKTGRVAVGWSGLARNLGYKAARVIEVNPAYTSQTCAECGHIAPENRRSQSEFRCVSCGHTANADTNAAINILASGTRAAGRGEATALAASAIRQQIGEARSFL